MMQTTIRRISSSRASSSSGSPFASCRKVNFSDSSNTISTSSDSAAISKKPKRITKKERRLMVNSIVEKYRATNAGKFPSIKFIRQEIGGGHYIIREFLQELKYKSKNGICSSSEELHLVETFDNCEQREPSESADDPHDQIGEKCDGLNLVDPSKRNIDEESQELRFVDVLEISLAVSSENCNQREPFNFVDQEIREKQIQELTADNCPPKEDVTRRVEHEESTTGNPSVWENLASMARGIINFLKKA